ncbi:hypothetical protein HGRIS_012359 [Hohenbuehelia grisea]
MLAAKASPPVTVDQLQKLSSELAALSKSLSDSLGSLPSYDRRQYELQLKALESLLEELRALQPKTKFSFRRKAPSTVNPTSDDTATQPIAAAPSYTAPTTRLTLSSQETQYLSWDDLPSTSESSADRDVAISDLSNCVVDLTVATQATSSSATEHPNVKAIHVKNLKNCVLLLPDIDGSILLHDLVRCTIVIGCHQFRMHNSWKVDVYVAIPSNPIIETSSDIRFERCGPLLGGRRSAKAPSEPLTVQDFSHIRASPSPNWTILPGHARIQEWPVRGQEVHNVLGALLPTE